MVFGLKKLQDELFCVTEERNYFQGKYLEQVSEIAALKEDLRKARREILKLRGELMETSSTSLLLGADEGSLHDSTYQTPRRRSSSRRTTTTSLALPEEQDGHQHQEEKKDAEGDDDDEGNTGKNLPLQSADDGDEHNDDDEDDEEEEDDSDADTEAADIRQSAEKLLQWASYRSYARSSATNSPDQGSVSSGQQAAAAALEDSSTSLLGPMIPRTIESASLKNSMSEDSGGAPSPAAAPAVAPAAVATSSG